MVGVYKRKKAAFEKTKWPFERKKVQEKEEEKKQEYENKRKRRNRK